jgi:hypothetical protein
MDIVIRSKPFEELRYPTYGDYYDQNGKTKIDVAEQSNPLYEYLIAIHELVEYVLVKARKISIDQIEEFDQNCHSEEPGDDPSAPYYYEHQIASIVERIVCNELGLKWIEYENEIRPEYFSFTGADAGGGK